VLHLPNTQLYADQTGLAATLGYRLLRPADLSILKAWTKTGTAEVGTAAYYGTATDVAASDWPFIEVWGLSTAGVAPFTDYDVSFRQLVGLKASEHTAIGDDVWNRAIGVPLAGSYGTLAGDSTGRVNLTPAERDALTAVVWGALSRTLTLPSAQVATLAVSGSTITLKRGDTLSAALAGLGSLAGRTKLWFTVKRALEDPDSAALVQIVEGTGLVTLNGAAGTAGDGSVTVTDATAGNLTVALAARATALLETWGTYTYDVQILTASGVVTKAEGAFVVLADATRAVS
jgi:hypothetical protein